MKKGDYRYSFAVNANTGWREWIGSALRAVATFIDGRTSLAVNIDSDPYIPVKTRVKCLKLGLMQASALIKDEVWAEAIECHARERLDLWKEVAN